MALVINVAEPKRSKFLFEHENFFSSLLSSDRLFRTFEKSYQLFVIMVKMTRSEWTTFNYQYFLLFEKYSEIPNFTEDFTVFFH